MARDKRNHYQQSAGQIRGLIKKFKTQPINWNAYQLAKNATDIIVAEPSSTPDEAMEL